MQVVGTEIREVGIEVSKVIVYIPTSGKVPLSLKLKDKDCKPQASLSKKQTPRSKFLSHG